MEYQNMKIRLVISMVGLAFLLVGCRFWEKDDLVAKAKAEEKNRQFQKELMESRQRNTQVNRELSQLSDEKLKEILFECKDSIMAYAEKVWRNGSSVGPQIINAFTPINLPESETMKITISTDDVRVSNFRAYDKMFLESGDVTLDTREYVLMTEDTETGPREKIMHYQCDLHPGLNITVSTLDY
jgi:hypothetical protein